MRNSTAMMKVYIVYNMCYRARKTSGHGESRDDLEDGLYLYNNYLF